MCSRNGRMPGRARRAGVRSKRDALYEDPNGRVVMRASTVYAISRDRYEIGLVGPRRDTGATKHFFHSE